MVTRESWDLLRVQVTSHQKNNFHHKCVNVVKTTFRTSHSAACTRTVHCVSVFLGLEWNSRIMESV